MMRPGADCERDAVIEAGARHLGFARVRETVRGPIRWAINEAIRRGVLSYEGRSCDGGSEEAL